MLSQGLVERAIFSSNLREVMKNTTEKELDVLVPLPLIHSIHEGLRSYEGTRLGKPRPCPHCGQIDYHRHDKRPRTFAVLVE